MSMRSSPSVRPRAARVPGGEPVTVPGLPPSFFGYLTDHQLTGVAVFCGVHSRCCSVDFDMTWDYSLTVVEDLVVSCSICGDCRTYSAGGG
jgi:hypothetical protein